jgi:hypothetical protein
MLKRLLGLTLLASIACTGLAQAQSVTTPAVPSITTPGITTPAIPSVTITAKPASSIPGATTLRSLADMPIGELASIGVGAVVGVILFDEAVWDGFMIVGAALGGWAGDYLYRTNYGTKPAA